MAISDFFTEVLPEAFKASRGAVGRFLAKGTEAAEEDGAKVKVEPTVEAPKVKPAAEGSAEAAEGKAPGDTAEPEAAAPESAPAAEVSPDAVAREMERSGVLQRAQDRLARLALIKTEPMLVRKAENVAINAATTSEEATTAIARARSAAEQLMADSNKNPNKIAKLVKGLIGVEKDGAIKGGVENLLKQRQVDADLAREALTQNLNKLDRLRADPSSASKDLFETKLAITNGIKTVTKTEAALDKTVTKANNMAYSVEHDFGYKFVRGNTAKTVVAGVVGYEAWHLAGETEEGKKIEDKATSVQTALNANSKIVAPAVTALTGDPNYELGSDLAATTDKLVNKSIQAPQAANEYLTAAENWAGMKGFKSLGLWSPLAKLLDDWLVHVLQDKSSFFAKLIGMAITFCMSMFDKLEGLIPGFKSDSNHDIVPNSSPLTPTIPVVAGPGVQNAPGGQGATTTTSTTITAGDSPEVAAMRANIVQAQNFLKAKNAFSGEANGVVTAGFTSSVQQYLKDEVKRQAIAKYGTTMGGMAAEQLYNGPVTGRVDTNLIGILDYLRQNPPAEMQQKNPEFMAALPAIISGMQNPQMLAALQNPPAQAAPTVVADAPAAKAPDAAAPATDQNIKPASLVVPDTQTATAPVDTAKKQDAAPADKPYSWVDGAFDAAKLPLGWIPYVSTAVDGGLAYGQFEYDKNFTDKPKTQIDRQLTQNLALAAVSAVPIPGAGEAALAVKVAANVGKMGVGVAASRELGSISDANHHVTGGDSVPDNTTQTPGKTPPAQQKTPATPDQQITA